MKRLSVLLALGLLLPLCAFADEDCSYIGSWFGYDSAGEVAWTSQAVGQSRSGGTMLLELPGFDVTFGGMFDVAKYTGNLKGEWKRTGGNTFKYAGISFATGADGKALWVIRLTGDVAVVGDCDKLEVSNTWMSIYLVDADTDPVPIWLRAPDIGPIPFAPHDGYRVEVELP